MLGKIIHPIIAFLLKDFHASIRSRRLAISSLLFGAVILLAAWVLGQAGLGAEGSGGDSSVPIGERGPDGALSVLAFGIMPLVLPLVPIVLAQESLRTDWATGRIRLSISKPVPKWGMVTGKFLGLFAALAIPLVPLSLAGAFLLQSILGTPADSGLIAAFVGSNMVLAALYLLLALLVGTVFTTRNLPVAMLLLWIGFNVLRPTAFELTGQLIGLLPAGGNIFFEVAWTDTLTFTGLYQGLLALFVPQELEFVVGPASSSFVPLVVRLSILPWIMGLVALHATFLERIPAR